MLFFGKRERQEDPGAVAREIAAALERAAVLPEGPLRHGALAACLGRAGGLAQGLGDAAEEGRAAGADAEGAMRLAAELARALWRSWCAGGATPLDAIAPFAPAAAGPVRIREPEGLAQYAVYPETYALAARALRGAPALAVVGLRSAGTTLAASVAAGAEHAATPITVRPGGEPWDRRVAIGSDRLLRAAAVPGATFAIADEGPGLSGSSFASVARVLLAAGVPRERIHLFPSHPHGAGARASEATRALLAAHPSHHVTFEAAFLDGGPLGLERLAGDLLGPARLVADLSGGRWRARTCGDPGGWPASTGWLERRKLLLEAGGRLVLARYAGLGAAGERKLARARALADAELGIPPLGLRHGFLLEPWLHGARPLARGGASAVTRGALLDALRRLVTLSAARRRPAEDGAPPEALLELVRVNAAEALGPAAGEAARSLEDLLPGVVTTARPCEVDGRSGPWEWLVGAGGRLLKVDGLDHAAGHELAGCQDALWDVAGASLAFDLDGREVRSLADAAREAAPGADPALLPFYRAAFAALEVGRWSFALAGEPPGAERVRREAALGETRTKLAAALAEAVALRRARPRSRPPLADAP